MIVITSIVLVAHGAGTHTHLHTRETQPARTGASHGRRAPEARRRARLERLLDRRAAPVHAEARHRERGEREHKVEQLEPPALAAEKALRAHEEQGVSVRQSAIRIRPAQTGRRLDGRRGEGGLRTRLHEIAPVAASRLSLRK